MAAQNPDVLARLLARLAQYNQTLIPNIVQPFDTNSCPQHFPSDAWTPWLNSTPPLPPAPPTPPHPGLNSSIERSQEGVKKGKGLLASGWCCDGEWPDGGYESSTVVVRVDPLPPSRQNPVLATFQANLTRAGLNTTHHVCPNQQHGFQWLLDIPKYGLVPKIKYQILFNVIRAPEAGGKEQALHNSPQCVRGGEGVAC